MTEIEPTIENVKLGDVVVLESGTPNSPGWIATAHKVLDRGGFHAITIETLACNLENGKRLARITRPAPPIPTTPGERFWAVGSSSQKPREYLVTGARAVVALDWGTQWDLADFPYTVVPAPEPETVPVPADIIREVESWADETKARVTFEEDILHRIVRAVRGWEVEL